MVFSSTPRIFYGVSIQNFRVRPFLVRSFLAIFLVLPLLSPRTASAQGFPFKDIWNAIDREIKDMPSGPLKDISQGCIVEGITKTWCGLSCVEIANILANNICAELTRLGLGDKVEIYQITAVGGTHTFPLIIVNGYYIILDPWAGYYETRPGRPVPRNGEVSYGGVTIQFDGSGTPVAGQQPGSGVLRLPCPKVKKTESVEAF